MWVMPRDFALGYYRLPLQGRRVPRSVQAWQKLVRTGGGKVWRGHEPRGGPTPLPPSHALGAHGRGMIYVWPVPQGGGPPTLRSGGPCPGLLSAAPPGQESATVCAGMAKVGENARGKGVAGTRAKGRPHPPSPLPCARSAWEGGDLCLAGTPGRRSAYAALRRALPWATIGCPSRAGECHALCRHGKSW